MSAAPQEIWATLPQEQRDAAYNNNSAVKNSAELIEKRNALSAVYRKAHASALDLPYGGKPRMAFDIYPAAQAAAPCLVFIHGGYWQRNSREPFATYAEGANAAGWSVAMPSHTLAPEATLSEIVAELRQSLDWLAQHGEEYGVAGPVILSGWSAGGHLTAMLLDHPFVVAGLAISGVFELATIRETYLNAALKLTDEEVATLSPLRLPIINKPMAIAYGDAELPALVYDSCQLHARRTLGGAKGQLVPVAGADHFTILDEFRAGGQLLRTAQDLFANARKFAA